MKFQHLIRVLFLRIRGHHKLRVRAMDTSKQLPHDLLAEKAFIGCLLIDNRSFDEVTDIVAYDIAD